MADLWTTIRKPPGTGGPPTRERPPLGQPDPVHDLDHDPDADNPPGSGGTTTAGGGQGTTEVSGAISGNPALTSATTTAVTPQDSAADQADDDLQAFFSTGTGPAQHYHVVSSSEAQPVEAETVDITRPTPRPHRRAAKAAKKAKGK